MKYFIRNGDTQNKPKSIGQSLRILLVLAFFGPQALAQEQVFFTRAACSHDIELAKIHLNSDSKINVDAGLDCALKFSNWEMASLIFSQTRFRPTFISGPGPESTLWHRAFALLPPAILRIMLNNYGAEYTNHIDLYGFPAHYYLKDWDSFSVFRNSAVFERADFSIRNSYGSNFLHIANQRGNGHKIITELLSTNPNIDVNAQDREGRTPLMAAETKEMFQALLWHAKGLDLNLKDRQHRSAIWYAAISPDEIRLHLLMTDPRLTKPESTETDIEGNTLLFYALLNASSGELETWNTLLNWIGLQDPNQINQQGKALLHLLIRKGKLSDFMMFKNKYKPNIFLIDGYGQNAAAIKAFDPEVSKRLESFGFPNSDDIDQAFGEDTYQESQALREEILSDPKFANPKQLSKLFATEVALSQSSGRGKLPSLLKLMLERKDLGPRLPAILLLALAQKQEWRAIKEVLDAGIELASDSICPDENYFDKNFISIIPCQFSSTPTRILDQLAYQAIMDGKFEIAEELFRRFKDISPTGLIWNKTYGFRNYSTMQVSLAHGIFGIAYGNDDTFPPSRSDVPAEVARRLSFLARVHPGAFSERYPMSFPDAFRSLYYLTKFSDHRDHQSIDQILQTVWDGQLSPNEVFELRENPNSVLTRFDGLFLAIRYSSMVAVQHFLETLKARPMTGRFTDSKAWTYQSHWHAALDADWKFSKKLVEMFLDFPEFQKEGEFCLRSSDKEENLNEILQKFGLMIQKIEGCSSSSKTNYRIDKVSTKNKNRPK